MYFVQNRVNCVNVENNLMLFNWFNLVYNYNSTENGLMKAEVAN